MVTITDGVKSFRVSLGAVKVFENLGFHIEDEEEMEKQENEYADDEEESIPTSVSKSRNREVAMNEGGSKEDAYIEELLEKPLSQWSNEEVKDFVKIKGIDTSGAQKVSQVRGIIKTYLEEQSRNI